MSPATRHS